MRNTSVPAHNCRHFAMQRQHYGGIVIALAETERQFFGTRDARFTIAVVVHTELRNHERRIVMTARAAER